ncbi:MAG TPA: J domain-containing protein [Novosphingobium sp.]|nr:J domain-containing protein [Novosphingobium sp. 17-62-19]HQS95054.1 J domain-containing protein [Novosphingobium sp.]
MAEEAAEMGQTPPHFLERPRRSLPRFGEARRTEMRHGGLYVVRQTFKGFTALPAPDATSPTNWWTVLGIPRTASRAEIEAAYRDKIRTAHPDTGGTTEAASAINRARDEAFKERTYNV